MPHTVIQVQDDRVVEVFTDQIINDPVYPILPLGQAPVKCPIVPTAKAVAVGRRALLRPAGAE